MIRIAVATALFILLSTAILTAADSGSAEEREMVEMLELFDDYNLYREMEFYVTMDETAIEHDKGTPRRSEEKVSE